MTSANEYDDPDEYLDDEDESDPGDGEWREGECDHCHGETVDGPLGPIHCARDRPGRARGRVPVRTAPAGSGLTSTNSAGRGDGVRATPRPAVP